MNAKDANHYAVRARNLVASGNPTRAVDVLRDARERFPAHGELEFLHALALAKSGSLSAAAELLAAFRTRLDCSDPLYAETHSLIGRIAKDQWARLAPGDARRSELLRASRAAYMEAFEASGAPFPGINAATMGLLAGERVFARRMALQVRDACRVAERRPDDHWAEATCAEALLLLGDMSGSIAAYQRALAMAGDRAGDVASMRRQILLLAGVVEGIEPLIEALRGPPIIAFAGHMIDDASRPRPRFPARMEPVVLRSIQEALSTLKPGVGYSSAACGADLLFIEEMVRRGLEVNILLPFRRADFIETSVRHAGARWVERFERALNAASSVTYSVDEGYLGDRCLFEYNSLLTQGFVVLRAEQLATRPVLLAVLDRAEEHAMGGTMQTVRQWTDLGLPSHVVDLAAIRGEEPSEGAVQGSTVESRPAAYAAGSVGARGIKTMLFADVAGFSKLQEEEAPAFFFHFLAKVADAIESAPVRPRFFNTWGDGLFVVFDAVEAAAGFALGLRDAIAVTDWEALGLPAQLTVRIGMHSGPVFETEDPVLKRPNYFGAHVNRAARIEPMAAPGSIYVSEQTAALVAAGAISGIACDYVGTVKLPKDFGHSRLFRMRRATEFE